MVKIVITRLKSPSKRSNAPPVSVTEKRVRDPEGGMKTLRIIHFNPRTFGSDFLYVFRKNVDKARRENNRITGAADLVVKKR